MSRTYALLIALLLRIAAAAQSNPFTVAEWNVVTGRTFTITWEPTTKGTVTISLISNTGDIQDVKSSVLDASIMNSGSLDWVFKYSNSSLFYTIELQSDSDHSLVNFSPPFPIRHAKRGDGHGDANPSTTTSSPLVTSDVPTSTTPPIPSSTRSHSSSGTTLGAGSADTRTTGSSLSPESSNPSSAGLSAGAAAGIGVGATLGALILVAIGGFFWWRQRKRSSKSEISVSARTGFFWWRQRKGSTKPEISASVSALDIIESESKKRASELEGTGKIPAELQGTPRAELE
ncbi:hypothetical protein VE04_09183, partial [Pseudogymnoascus sp. 24MN13]